MRIIKWIIYILLLAVSLLVLSQTNLWASGENIEQNTALTPSTVKTEWCLKQIEKVAKKENECRSELSKTAADLQREKSKKDTLVEKLGILAIGSGLAFTNFNPLGCLIAGYLILFQ